MQHHLCKNCDRTFEGHFCSHCGQKSSVSELNMHDLVHEFWHSITHTDKGILKVVKDLFLHPKKVYHGYFAGQRKTYFSPVTFFLITATLLLIIGDKIYDYEDAVHMANNPYGYNEFGRTVFEATKFRSLFTIPCEVLVTWLLFRKQFNFAKNVVFWIYFNALLFTIDLIVSPLYFPFILQKATIELYVLFIGYVFLFWHVLVVFTNKKWTDYLISFLVVNCFHIINYVTIYLLLFGTNVLKQTKTNNVFEFLIHLYRF